ncbi:MAG: N-acetylglucosamine-6-phosphate deacetylase [Chitinophagaceae bacterium]
MIHAYTNATIFNGTVFVEDHSVIVADNIIQLVAGNNDLPADIVTIDCQEHLLVPAFMDLQIYGAGGKLFSAFPGPDSLELLARQNANSGTANCLVTIATQPMDVIEICIEAIKMYWQQGGKGILGMHLEGPFINALKSGAHIKEWMVSPTPDEVKSLLEKAAGVIKMVTLAPECIDPEIIPLFVEHGIVVSIGHSNATLAEANAAFDSGTTTTTHLFNAMSALHHRQPGLPAATMLHPGATASIIPDGIHVDYETVRLAKKMMGDRLFFITDAVTETNSGPYQHVLNTNHYDLPDGTLSGSALTMLQAVKNAVDHCHISLKEALRMVSLYPARVMRLEQQYGKIETGFTATFALVDRNLSAAIVPGFF